MSGNANEKLARLLVDYSVNLQPGEKIVIETTTLAEPLVTEIYKRVLEKDGLPHILLELPEQNKIFYSFAQKKAFEYIPIFNQVAVENFDARIKIQADNNTRALSKVDPQKVTARQMALSPLLHAKMKRGGDGSLKWVGTLYPTAAHALEANMGLDAYTDFVHRACHVDDSTPDPVAYWISTYERQQKVIAKLDGHDQIVPKGANVDLNLSIKGRTFLNSCGTHNMPDGEVFTGPVEDSANGWVRITYPAIYAGKVVEDIELTFKDGQRVNYTYTPDGLMQTIADGRGTTHYAYDNQVRLTSITQPDGQEVKLLLQMECQ